MGRIIDFSHQSLAIGVRHRKLPNLESKASNLESIVSKMPQHLRYFRVQSPLIRRETAPN